MQTTLILIPHGNGCSTSIWRGLRMPFVCKVNLIFVVKLAVVDFLGTLEQTAELT